MITKKQAKEIFAKYIKKPCTVCPAMGGELCDTKSVWVHAERMK